MATINDEGNVTARCGGCGGAISSFIWLDVSQGRAYGSVDQKNVQVSPGTVRDLTSRVFRCSGCGIGALGIVSYSRGTAYPGQYRELRRFWPEATERLRLPVAVPEGIKREFREAESCMEADCYRAAAGLFRSVLDKTMRANGYKLKAGTTLEQQIDFAANDGTITEARRKRAHEDIRVLGNDVLHDDWHSIDPAAVEEAHKYAQRILEDLYDDRETVLQILREKGRVPAEDNKAAGPTAVP